MSPELQDKVKAYGAVLAKLEYNQAYEALSWPDVGLVPVSRTGLGRITRIIETLEGNIEELIRMFKDDSTTALEREVIQATGQQNRRYLRIAQEAKETIEIILSQEPFI